MFLENSCPTTVSRSASSRSAAGSPRRDRRPARLKSRSVRRSTRAAADRGRRGSIAASTAYSSGSSPSSVASLSLWSDCLGLTLDRGVGMHLAEQAADRARVGDGELDVVPQPQCTRVRRRGRDCGAVRRLRARSRADRRSGRATSRTTRRRSAGRGVAATVSWSPQHLTILGPPELSDAQRRYAHVVATMRWQHPDGVGECRPCRRRRRALTTRT